MRKGDCMGSCRFDECAGKDDRWVLLLVLEVNLYMGIWSRGLCGGKETHPHAFIHLIPIPSCSFNHSYIDLRGVAARESRTVCVQDIVYSCKLGRSWRRDIYQCNSMDLIYLPRIVIKGRKHPRDWGGIERNPPQLCVEEKKVLRLGESLDMP